MKYKLKVWQQLVIAFGIIFLGFLVNSLLTLQIVNKNNELNEKYQKVYAPSAKYVDELYKLVNESRFLIKNWVWVEQKDIDESTDKLRLVELIKESYPSLVKKLDTLSVFWPKETLAAYTEAKKETKYLFEQHFVIINDLLNDFASYSDPLSKSQAQMMVDPDFGEIMISSDAILSKLLVILNNQNQIVKSSNEELTRSSNRLGTIIIFLTIIVGVLVAVIGFITTRSIVKPMVYIQNILLEMSKGKLPENKLVQSSNEVGQMAFALNVLIGSSKKTSQFADKVGHGEFDHQFTPLSEHDILGNSLIVMRDQLKRQIQELKENEEFLEQKVEERTREVVAQKEVIEKKNKDITSSINYAQRIQKAILPPKKQVINSFNDSFVHFYPRDIVSGDFYWHLDIEGRTIIAAIDCTGHGVPGAFMSLIGETYLRQIVEGQKIYEPDLILNKLHINIRKALKQEGKEEIQDGMDMALCTIDHEKQLLEFAGAKNPLVFIQDDELKVIKGDKFPIGGTQFKKETSERRFTKHVIDISKPTTFYIFSDGYADQFGGERKRKFMQGRLNKAFHKIYKENCKMQDSLLYGLFAKWKGDEKQLDDILIIGCKIN